MLLLWLGNYILSYLLSIKILNSILYSILPLNSTGFENPIIHIWLNTDYDPSLCYTGYSLEHSIDKYDRFRKIF